MMKTSDTELKARTALKAKGTKLNNRRGATTSEHFSEALTAIGTFEVNECSNPLLCSTRPNSEPYSDDNYSKLMRFEVTAPDPTGNLPALIIAAIYSH